MNCICNERTVFIAQHDPIEMIKSYSTHFYYLNNLLFCTRAVRYMGRIEKRFTTR